MSFSPMLSSPRSARAALPWVALDAEPPAAPMLTWPFDLMRAQYASAVEAGLIERSILASREFERSMARLERWSLGPFARRV